MDRLDLLNLDLHAALAYRGLENPPLAGVPPRGRVLLPCPGAGLVERPLGTELAEGEEELFAFEAEELVRFDPDEGPRVASPFPAPRYYGRAASSSSCGSCPARGGACGSPPEAGPSSPAGVAAAAGGSAAEAGEERRLPAGRYLFMQFRPADEAELAAGLEWFAREAWWAGDPGSGPYFVRRVKEDGKLATQVLRAANC